MIARHEYKHSVAVRLSWLENACSRPLFTAGDFDPKSR